MLLEQNKIIRLRLPLSVKISNLYWGWWDLINTSIVILFLVGLLIYSSFYIMGVFALPYNMNLSSIRQNPELGLGLLGFTASAGSAAGLWVLSNCIGRWSVINRVIYINNEFLAEIGYLSSDNIKEWRATLRAYIWAISLLNDKLLSLNSPAQKHLYGSLIYSNILMDSISTDDRDMPEEIAAAHHKRLTVLYAKICLSVLYLNGRPQYVNRMLAESVSSLAKDASYSSRKLFSDLNTFVLPVTTHA